MAARKQAILGLGGSDHDIHACLSIGEDVVVMIEEERLSRRKYGLGGDLLEGLARRYCFDTVGKSLDAVDEVVRDQIMAMPAYAACRSRAQAIDHHMCHAAMAFYTSGFDRAAILVVDNAGGLYRDDDGVDKLQATSWYLGEGRDIHFLGRIGSRNWVNGPMIKGEPYQRGDGDDSIGHFYKKLSGALGFRFPRTAGRRDFYFPEDGITMGLASYGDDRFTEAVCDFVKFEAGGDYSMPLTDGRLDRRLDHWLSVDDGFETKAAIAAAGQEALTRVMCHLVSHLIEITGEARVCISGGVAMNSSANGEILKRTPTAELYVPFAPGDNGTGLGALLRTAAKDPDRPLPRVSVYGGRIYAEDQIRAALAEVDLELYDIHEDMDEGRLIEEVVERLCDKKVIALFQGGSETGRRALGHRSLLADPRDGTMRDHINSKVKCREHFRPFAPAVLADMSDLYFEMKQESPYMQIVFQVREAMRDKLAAVAHVDQSARVQTVRRREEPRLYEMIRRFGERTGIYVLLNTSLNGPGEPIVETPQQAVAALSRLNVDGLLLQDRLITRR